MLKYSGNRRYEMNDNNINFYESRGASIGLLEATGLFLRKYILLDMLFGISLKEILLLNFARKFLVISGL